MKYIIANFKQNGDQEFYKTYFQKLQKILPNSDAMFALPCCYLHLAKQLGLKNLCIGSQMVGFVESGAQTGGIGASMLKDLDAKFALVGHSENRKNGETNSQIAKKLSILAKNNITAILCVGENITERDKFKVVLEKQLGVLKHAKLDNIIIAYEPVWAIGTGQVASQKNICDAHKFIKKVVKEKFFTQVPVIYGGSVKSVNSGKILSLDCVDGVLVGGASLSVEEFCQIYNSQFNGGENESK